MLPTLVLLATLAADERLIAPIPLEPDERAWLIEHPRIRVHFEPWPPFLLEEEGHPTGITADYIELVAGELGLEIEWVRSEWTRALEGTRGGGIIDVLPILTRTSERETFLHFTDNYVSFPIVIFSRVDAEFIGGLADLRRRRVVVERSYAMHARLQRDLPEENLVVVDTTPTALRTVATGGADAYLGHLAVGNYLIQRHGLANLKIAAPAPYGTHDQAMGVRHDWPELARLLERGLSAVTHRGHASIRRRWLSVQYEGIHQRDIWIGSLGVAFTVTVLLALGLLWVRRLRRQVSVRRRTEAELERNRYQLVEAEHLTGMGSWTYDGGSEQVTWSPQTFELMGRSPELGAPEKLSDHAGFFHADDWVQLLRAVMSAIDGGRPYELELRLQRGDGDERTVVCRGARPPDSDRRELIGTFQDVTEERRMTAQRERLLGQLREAQKLESIGSLVGDVAHDFNDLLVSIRGNTELTLEGLPPEAAGADELREVLSATESASHLCRQMLAYSGESSLLLDQTDLSSVVRGMSRMLDVSLSKKATVELNLADGLPGVAADPAQLQQVVLNLALNASESLEDNTGVITITTGANHCTTETFAAAYPPDLPPGEYVTLTVNDTGCGMDSRARDQVFDPFFSTKTTGRGMGMAALLGIVRAHRGAIRVESETGQGTAVTVWLPCTNEPTVEKHPAAPKEHAGGRRPTVLIVDDNDGVRRTAGRALVRRGFDVLEAANGRTALEMIAKHDHTNCVILDITMPELDGVEAYKELMKTNPDLPVVMTSGYHTHERIPRVGTHPVGFVQKPFDVRTLVDAVHEALGHADG